MADAYLFNKLVYAMNILHARAYCNLILQFLCFFNVVRHHYYQIIIFYLNLLHKKQVQLNQLHPHLFYSLLIARPPATGRIAPVIKSARSLAKNATALAMS